VPGVERIAIEPVGVFDRLIDITKDHVRVTLLDELDRRCDSHRRSQRDRDQSERPRRRMRHAQEGPRRTSLRSSTHAKTPAAPLRRFPCNDSWERPTAPAWGESVYALHACARPGRRERTMVTPWYDRVGMALWSPSLASDRTDQPGRELTLDEW